MQNTRLISKGKHSNTAVKHITSTHNYNVSHQSGLHTHINTSIPDCQLGVLVCGGFGPDRETVALCAALIHSTADLVTARQQLLADNSDKLCVGRSAMSM